jgi:hypothetical protein
LTFLSSSVSLLISSFEEKVTSRELIGDPLTLLRSPPSFRALFTWRR